MGVKVLRRLTGAILAIALLGAAACGSSKEDELPPASPTDVASATAEASEAPGASPTAAPTNGEAALAAVTELIERANEGRCSTQYAGTECHGLSLDIANSGTDFDHGLGSFHVKVAGLDDTTIVVGRMSNGQWFQYLWGNPQYHQPPTYQPTTLPAEVTICAFGGEADVRSSANPSSAKVGAVATGELVTADEFALTLPGSIGNAAVNIQGYGWYHITEPAGWVYSKYVAEGPGCELHDILERP